MHIMRKLNSGVDSEQDLAVLGDCYWLSLCCIFVRVRVLWKLPEGLSD